MLGRYSLLARFVLVAMLAAGIARWMGAHASMKFLGLCAILESIRFLLEPRVRRANPRTAVLALWVVMAWSYPVVLSRMFIDFFSDPFVTKYERESIISNADYAATHRPIGKPSELQYLTAPWWLGQYAQLLERVAEQPNGWIQDEFIDRDLGKLTVRLTSCVQPTAWASLKGETAQPPPATELRIACEGKPVALFTDERCDGLFDAEGRLKDMDDEGELLDIPGGPTIHQVTTYTLFDGPDYRSSYALVEKVVGYLVNSRLNDRPGTWEAPPRPVTRKDWPWWWLPAAIFAGFIIFVRNRWRELVSF